MTRRSRGRRKRQTRPFATGRSVNDDGYLPSVGDLERLAVAGLIDRTSPLQVLGATVEVKGDERRHRAVHDSVHRRLAIAVPIHQGAAVAGEACGVEECLPHCIPAATPLASLHRGYDRLKINHIRSVAISPMPFQPVKITAEVPEPGRRDGTEEAFARPRSRILRTRTDALLKGFKYQRRRQFDFLICCESAEAEPDRCVDLVG